MGNEKNEGCCSTTKLEVKALNFQPAGMPDKVLQMAESSFKPIESDDNLFKKI